MDVAGKKILVIRFSSIGDIVLISPVLRVLKNSGASVHVATKESFRSILEANPQVDKVHSLQDNLNALIQELQEENFDFVADLHHNLRSSIIRFRLGKKSAAFPKLNLRKWWLVFSKNKRVMPPVHIVQRYLKTLEPLGLRDDGRGLEYFIPARQEVDLQTLPPSFRNGYVAFVIGAQHATKRMPISKILEALRYISMPVLLLGGKDDRDRGEEIISYSEHPALHNACGLYSLHQSASLVKQSFCVVSHDTGLMHIAAAFQKKIYSIWGNTLPELGMYPYKTEHLVLENNAVSCRPCSKLGYDKCPKGHFKCMMELDLKPLQTIRKG
ncbi:MAG: glycosyltransferase family 9 protein [Cytophagaceae bacterium]|jgi:ADP-heptose:LPS heptosyltransferase|nr:glycosyltransferase family 9 protein [Cytophagaceae bacterium]